MNRLVLFFFLLVYIPLQSSGQSSLEKLLSISNSEERLDSILLTAWHYIDEHELEKAVKYSNEALSLSRKLDLQLKEAESYLQLGFISLNGEANLDAAEKHFKSAYIIRKKLGEKIPTTSVCQHLVRLYLERGKLTEAEKIANQGLNIMLTLVQDTDEPSNEHYICWALCTHN